MTERPGQLGCSTPYFPFHNLDCVLRTIGRLWNFLCRELAETHDLHLGFVFTSASATGTTMYFLVLAFAVPCHDGLVLAGELWLNSELLSSATG